MVHDPYSTPYPTSNCRDEFDVTMSQYYIITEGIVQRLPFNNIPDLKLRGWVYHSQYAKVHLRMYTFMEVNELCNIWLNVWSYGTWCKQSTVNYMWLHYNKHRYFNASNTFIFEVCNNISHSLSNAFNLIETVKCSSDGIVAQI